MALFFYLFAALTLISSLGVISGKNPVHSVLWLIFAFCNSAGLMVLLGAEFLAMMLIVIYVGAVAVLFLFTVMMLDTDSVNKIFLSFNKKGTILLASFLFIDLMLIIFLGTGKGIGCLNEGLAIDKNISNVHLIGKFLYTDFILPFQISGIILFVAMIASISLTIEPQNLNAKRQNPLAQLRRNKESGMKIVKPQLQKGVEEINYEDKL